MNFENGSLIGRLHRCRQVVVALLLLLKPGESLLAADPYAAALDRQFSSEPGQTQHADPRVAALEEGIREQALEKAKEPEPSPAEAANTVERLVVWSAGALAVVAFGLAALVALRRWNRWLDTKEAQRTKAGAAMAEDPLMAEFLQTLHQELRHGPLSTPTPQTASPGSLPESGPALEPRSAPKGPGAVSNRPTLLRADLHRLSRTDDEAERLRILRDLLEGVEVIKHTSDLPHLHSSKLLASALQCLLKQLSLRVAYLTPSALRTAAAAVDLLEYLCPRALRPDLATTPPVRLLAVDDDPISLRAVTFSLKKAFDGSDAAVDGPSALALAIQQPYDVIFLDIEMPGMDGFELCSKIHETAANRTTPVVFVTTHTDFNSRAKSAVLGAQDLIAKPFLAFEITVKALTLVLRAREEREARCGASGHEQNESGPAAANAALGERGSPAKILAAQNPAPV